MMFSIWLPMYWRNIRDVNVPIIIVVVSDAPLNLKTIVPPALKGCTPTRSGVIPACMSFRFETAFLRCCCIMLVCEIRFQVFVLFCYNSHKRGLYLFLLCWR